MEADHLFTGRCTGGPLDGHEIAVRTEAFLAVDRERGLAWLYQQVGDRFEVSADHDDSLIYPQGATTGERRLDLNRAWQAGLESASDGIAVGDD